MSNRWGEDRLESHKRIAHGDFAVDGLGCNGSRVAPVTRLVTFVDMDDRANDDYLSVSARHEAVLADGRRVLLLRDRGWGESGPEISGLTYRSKASWTRRAWWSDRTSLPLVVPAKTRRQSIGHS